MKALKFLAASVSVVAFASLTVSAPSLPGLKALLAASVKLATVPDLNNSIPTLQSLASGRNTPILSSAPFPWQCDPESSTATIPADPAKTCAFGDRSARTTVLVTGDSQAAMWLAALNVAGTILRFKIVYLAEPACAPWGNPNPPSYKLYKDITVASCNVWRHSIERVAKVLHPRDVILDGLAYPMGSNLKDKANQADFDQRLGASVRAFRASGAKVLLLSPLPNYFRNPKGWTPTSCLVGVKSIKLCEYPPTQLIDVVANTGERKVASEHLATFVPITSLLCTSRACALFVRAKDGTHLVFFDIDHLNTYYSTWVGRSMAALLKPTL